MARDLRNWLRAYMEFTSDTEPSDAYHFWTAVTIIGAATKKQVYLDMNYFRVYPNMYTFIVGPSGSRKGVATSIGMSIATQAEIRKSSNKMTAAALIKDLSDSVEKRIVGAEVEFVTPIMIYSSELGVLMGPDAYTSGLIADLTDLWDWPDKPWEKKTISRGTDTIMNPFVSILAATTTQTIKDVIPQAAVGQGFTSRLILVWSGGRRKRAPIPDWGSGHEMLEKKLVSDLKKVGAIKGIFTFSEGGLKLYKSHYMDRPEPEDEYEDERLQGYGSRKDIHTLKVAMILSLADKDELIITERDMAGAIDAIKWLDKGLSHVLSDHGQSAAADSVNKIFKQIEIATRKAGYINDEELSAKAYHYAMGQEYELIIQTLIKIKAIEEVIGRDPKTGRPGKLYRAKDSKFMEKAVVRVTKKIGGEG